MNAKVPWTATSHNNGNIDVVLPNLQVITFGYRNGKYVRVGPHRTCTAGEFARAMNIAKQHANQRSSSARRPKKTWHDAYDLAG